MFVLVQHAILPISASYAFVHTVFAQIDATATIIFGFEPMQLLFEGGYYYFRSKTMRLVFEGGGSALLPHLIVLLFDLPLAVAASSPGESPVLPFASSPSCRELSSHQLQIPQGFVESDEEDELYEEE